MPKINMNSLQNYLNNREIAIGTWILLAGVLALFCKSIRKSFADVVKAFFASKLVFSYLLMFFYIGMSLFVFKSIGLWKWSQSTNTLLWVIFVAFGMLFNQEKAIEDKFFINSIKCHFKVIVILEFIVNIYVFNIYIELLMVPLMFLIGALAAFSRTKDEWSSVNKFANRMLSLAGTFLIAHFVYMSITDFGSLMTTRNIENFYTPIMLSITFLPFIYLAAVAINYENLFTRLHYFMIDESVKTYAKRSIFVSFGISLNKINRWAKYMNKCYFDSNFSVDKAIAQFKVLELESA